ncbi:MAG: cell division protein FtsA [Bacilli bacterium]|nr:cell division protein FtsA [Bacilli bacterium]
MKNIYTGIELGTNSIKIVVLEKNDDQYHVLASVSTASSGIKNGQVVEMKSAIACVKEAIKEVSDMLGIKITKVVACVPPTDCKMDIVVGSSDVLYTECVSGEDISNAINDALRGQNFDEYELVTATPISFKLDEQENIKDPKGMKGEVLETRVVISTLPKEGLYRILEVLKLSGVEAVDIAFSSTGDYYTIKNDRYDDVVGAIINIGETSTNISVFNKGIQIKHSIIPIGSYNVDKDISYVFKIHNNDARKLKETFAVSMSSYADNNDIVEVKDKNCEKKVISQVGISKIVEARLREILKFAKNEIKNLTNREIRYIIITGGLSEIAGFSYLIEEEFGNLAKVCNISTMGIRHNKYSSALGIVKYFDDKLSLRGKSYNMLNKEDIESLISTGQKLTNNDNIISKVFGHFFDN